VSASAPSRRDRLAPLRGLLSRDTSVLFAASFFTPLAAFMLYPFLIIDFTHLLGFSAVVAGLLLSVRFLSSAALGFVGGWAAERFGLARTYAVAGIVTSAAILGLSWARTIPLLILLLAVLGLAASTVNACVRGMTNIAVPPAQRGRAQNVIHWLNNIGMAAALPFSAYVLGAGHSVLPFWAAAGVYAAMALAVAVSIGAPAAREETAAPPDTRTRAGGPLRLLAEDPAFLLLLVSFVLWVAVEYQFESGVPLDMSYHFAGGARLYGILGVVDMAVVFLLQLWAADWLERRLAAAWGFVGFLLLGGLAVGGVWQTAAGWTVAIVLLSLGEVFSLGQIMNLLGKLPREGRQASYFALFGMAQGCGAFLAYGLSGAAYQGLHPLVLFLLCVPVAGLSGLFYRWAARRHAAVERSAGTAVGAMSTDGSSS
jgi:hypothetical protein